MKNEKLWKIPIIKKQITNKSQKRKYKKQTYPKKSNFKFKMTGIFVDCGANATGLGRKLEILFGIS
jgi:hypothetical protein